VPEPTSPSRVQLAVDAAVRQFRRSRRYRHRVKRAAVFAEEPGRLYVVVFYDERRMPPHRAWFSVSDVDGVVAEVSWAKAQRLGELPLR
jgi:hypothetical protein